MSIFSQNYPEMNLDVTLVYILHKHVFLVDHIVHESPEIVQGFLEVKYRDRDTIRLQGVVRYYTVLYIVVIQRRYEDISELPLNMLYITYEVGQFYRSNGQGRKV